MPMLRRGTLLFALCLTAVASALAQQSANDDFTPLMRQAAQKDPAAYTVDESTIFIEKLGPPANPAKIVLPGKQTPKEGPDPIVIIDQIINLLDKIWSIIEKNRPVVDIQTQYATATPAGITHWSQLEGWKPPQGTVYALRAKNLYGTTVVNVRYQVLRTCGGSYKGKGQYLTAVTIEPLNVDVLWGYKFSLAVEIPDSSVINVGTSENPLAGMTPLVKWTIATALKESNGRSLYYLQGDGLLQEIGGPFKRAYQEGVANALSKALKYGL